MSELAFTDGSSRCTPLPLRSCSSLKLEPMATSAMTKLYRTNLKRGILQFSTLGSRGVRTMIPIARFLAGRPITSKYCKSLSLPKGKPYLETAGGLRYWYVGNKSPCGSCQSILAEDLSISMHSYGNPDSRNSDGVRLFRYKGTSIGFITYRF